MRSQVTSNESLKLKKQCQIHSNKTKAKIVMLNLEKQKNDSTRFYCQYCIEDEDKAIKIKINIQNILDYTQVEVNEEEPSLEKKLPLDEKIKKSCRDQLMAYENNAGSQLERIENYINTLNNDISFQIELARQKALDYFAKLQEDGSNLEEVFKDIVDCSKIQEIIQSANNKEELNQQLSIYIIKMLQTDANNKQLNKLSSKFKETHSLYTTEAFTSLRKIIIDLASKITFDSQVQRNQSLGQVDTNISKATKCLQLIPTAILKTKFQNLSKQGYNVIANEDSSETLMAEQFDDIISAKYQNPIESYIFNQFVFEIKCGDVSQLRNDNYIIIGVAERDSDIQSMVWYKKFGSKYEKEEGGCSFVQSGDNLSTLQSETTRVVMNVHLQKNKFFFTDKQRKSKNIMKKKNSFSNDRTYYLYIQSKGQFSISLLHNEKIQ